jgi:hypothetical protein
MLIQVAKNAVEKLGLPAIVETGPLAFPLFDKTEEVNGSMPILDSVL